MAARKIANKGKNVVDKIIHPPYLKTDIPAGGAVAAPPLGPQLGQRGAQIGPFCKQFNDATADIKKGTPIPTYIRVNPNKSIDLTLFQPATTYFLKMAAGAKKGSREKDDLAGKVSLKHVYEIAKIKMKDPPNIGLTMEEMCKMIIGTAHTMGIEVVKRLEAEDYATFLEERKVIVEAYEQELEEKRKARLLRL